MKIKAFIAAASALLAVAPAALAQDSSLTATYGEISLSSGFAPDPYRIDLTAGGDIDASNLGSPCTGSIARAPDYQLTFSAGTLPLYVVVNAASDTTLVVNGPDGLWYCDDDSNGGTNPQVTWNSPQSGVYDIWVGTYGGGTTPAALFITELTDGEAVITSHVDNPAGSDRALTPNANLRAAYGEVSLTSGFTPDPHTVSLTAGGSINANAVSSSCAGSIAEAPDYQITYSAGSLPLTIRTDSGVDTTLVVNGPDGQWYCDDDSGGGTNAQVRFAKPSSGVYDIWVGTYSGGTNPARLEITEL